MVVYCQGMGTSLQIDLTDRALYADGFPHDVFTELRHSDPVRWHPYPDGFPGNHDEGFWVLSRHADIEAVNRNTALFKAFDGPQLGIQPEMAGNMMVSMDGPAHVRHRRLISAGFTPRMIGRLELQVRQWAEMLVDQALELGECDFVSEVAYKLPMNMIADIVGIPEQDRDWLFALANEFLQGGIGQDNPVQLHIDNQVRMFEYALALGQDKIANPQDDVWTILSTISVESEDGEFHALTQIELDLFFILLVVAGSETTRNAASQGLLALLRHPDQLDLLRRHPEAIPTAVEEMLRWSSPVSYFARRAAEDTEIRGVPIAKGDRISMWYPSGNRDEEVFADPFGFDIERSPNRHMAFGGGGAHFCLGASLARRELITLFEVLLERTREIELSGGPTYTSLGILNPILLFMDRLPVRLQ